MSSHGIADRVGCDPSDSMKRSIRDLTIGSCSLFREILSMLQPDTVNFDIVETELGRLNIWASNIGALAYNTASLDHRLRCSHDIKNLVTHALAILERNLKQGRKHCHE